MTATAPSERPGPAGPDEPPAKAPDRAAERALARAARELPGRVAALDWSALGEALDRRGHAVSPALLSAPECEALAALYARDAAFRKTVVLERFNFGAGSYRYFAAPLPAAVAALRRALYPPLAALAADWARRLGRDESFPPTLEAYRERCAARGQSEPTPLLLDYPVDGYNCLHQDLYGEIAFPLQATVMLSRPGEDFTGGEFLLVEQRPRMQSRGEAITLAQGECVLFPNRLRPVRGARGWYRVQVRHGVSRVRTGHRRTLGIIFHDAA